MHCTCLFLGVSTLFCFVALPLLSIALRLDVRVDLFQSTLGSHCDLPIRADREKTCRLIRETVLYMIKRSDARYELEKGYVLIDKTAEVC